MRLCRTGKHGATMRDGIPIFFSSCGKENGHSWSKEKTLRDELTGKAVNSPKTGAGRHELPKKSGSRLPAALYSFRPELRPPHLWVQSTTGSKTESAYFYHVRSASLRTTRSVFCFILVSRPSSSWGLVSKGGGRDPRPLCHWGSRAKSKRPGAFLPGVWDVFFSRKEYAPRPCGGNRPLREQETYAKARGDAARFPVIRNHDGCPSKFQALRKGK